MNPSLLIKENATYKQALLQARLYPGSIINLNIPRSYRSIAPNIYK
jgi:hypothetical protein